MPLERDGLLYKPNSNEPLTARVERYHDNGQLELEVSYVNGKLEGVARMWHENGQLMAGQKDFRRSVITYILPLKSNFEGHK